MSTRRSEEVEELLRAFAARDLDAIRRLADEGHDLDARGGGDLSVLMRSVLRGDAVAVEWILAAGADPNVRGDDGKSALDLARELDRPALAELLVMAGAEAEGPAEEPAAVLDEVPDEEPAERPIETPTPVPSPPIQAEPAPTRPARGRAWGDELDDEFDDEFLDGSEEDWLI